MKHRESPHMSWEWTRMSEQRKSLCLRIREGQPGMEGLKVKLEMIGTPRISKGTSGKLPKRIYFLKSLKFDFEWIRKMFDVLFFICKDFDST